MPEREDHLPADQGLVHEPLAAPLDCQRVEQEHVADRYVLHQLSPADTTIFEDHYMGCDTCAAAVEQAELLISGIKRIAAEDLSPQNLDHPESVDPGAAPRSEFEAARDRRREKKRPLLEAGPRGWGPLLAAALAGAVISAPLWLGSTDSMAPSATAVSVYHLQTERSAGSPSGHRIQPADGSIVLALELTPPVYSGYRGRLELGGQVVWQAEDLKLGERDTVHLLLPDDLDPGAYSLSLEGSKDDAWVDAGLFHFRLGPDDP